MTNRLKSWLLPSLADILFVCLLFYYALPPDKQLLGDGDTGYHIRAGDYILSTLTVPKTDIFSFINPAIPWTAHEWLSEVIMSLLHTIGGLTAVVLAFAILIAISTRVFFKNLVAEGNNILISATASIVFVSLAQGHYLARPHIFSLVILIYWYRYLNDYQYQQTDHLWRLPVIMLLWVNLHGGFIIGITIIGIYFAGNLLPFIFNKNEWESRAKEKAIRLGKILVITVTACIVNPTGYRIFLFPFNLVSNRYLMDHTNEFMSPNFHEFHPFKYLLLLLLVIFAFSRRKSEFIAVGLTLLFTSMSLSSVRYIPLFAVIVIPIMLRYVEKDILSAFPCVERFLTQRVNNITTADNMAKGFVWPAFSIILLAMLAINGTVTHSFNPEKKPMAAIEFLKSNPVTGNMFNNDEFGDLVIYSAYQQYKVFIDGRLDMYGSDRLKEYEQVMGVKTCWESVLHKYRISWFLIETDSLLSRFLSDNSNWKLVYSDKVASIFVKNIPVYAPLIKRFSTTKLAEYGKG